MVVKLKEVSMSINKEFNTLKFENVEGLGILTVNRPKSLNALNTEVHTELREFLTALKNEKDFSIKGLVLIGEGEKAFIAGADIKEMLDMSAEQAKAFSRLGQEVSLLFEELQIPVIAACNGFALGGGCEMAMACDFIYATQNAVFGQPEVKLGLVPGFGGSQRLSKLIGRNKAKEIIYTGRNVSIDEAMNLGLVVKVFETREELLSGALETLKKITRNSPHAVYISKKIMNEGNDLTIAKGLEIEAEQFGEIFSSEDKKEGTMAFVEKRKPVFTGK
jgi:enoyl-CoA hydratase